MKEYPATFISYLRNYDYAGLIALRDAKKVYFLSATFDEDSKGFLKAAFNILPNKVMEFNPVFEINQGQDKHQVDRETQIRVCKVGDQSRCIQ